MANEIELSSQEALRAVCLFESTIKKIELVELELVIQGLSSQNLNKFLDSFQWKYLSSKIYGDLEQRKEGIESSLFTFIRDIKEDDTTQLELIDQMGLENLREDISKSNQVYGRDKTVVGLKRLLKAITKQLTESETRVDNQRKLQSNFSSLGQIYKTTQSEISQKNTFGNIKLVIQELKEKNEKITKIRRDLSQIKYGNELLRAELSKEKSLQEQESIQFEKKLEEFEEEKKKLEDSFPKELASNQSKFFAEQEAEVRELKANVYQIEEKIEETKKKLKLEKYLAEKVIASLNIQLENAKNERERQENLKSLKLKNEELNLLHKENREIDKELKELEEKLELEEALMGLFPEIPMIESTEIDLEVENEQ